MSLHHSERIRVATSGPGLLDITHQVSQVLDRAGVGLGLVTCYVRHTSASLTIQENADPDVRTDLEAFLRRLVPEGDPLYRHTDEGPDDMPAHVKAALTATSLGIPVEGGELVLGTWQGIYLWEHRRRDHLREVVVHVSGEPQC
ncbi:MAG: secondary thiamine-phosphate synthase enzyme YjbQ [Myxococcota bacterium]|nr:secondary thiamine-phosphate synthase enzyme YjbQ [Myxococcota bacterium]